MGETIGTYLRYSARAWYALFLGAICGVAGAAKDMSLADWIPLPSWFWWVGFVLAVSGAQFSAFWRVHKDWASFQKPTPDMKFRQFFEQQFTSSDLNATGAGDQLMAWVVDVQQRARLETIHMWGRLDPLGWSTESVPLSLIPPEFWQDYQIDYLEILKDCAGKTEAIRSGVPRRDYEDFWFSRKEIEREWPKPRRSLWQRVSISLSKKPAVRGF